ncbi:hypothetical protein OPKNFCMD_5861 [Methylobacterium crusticola]|uniref:Uncharacterized protein n=1 Tax=Methylobacterium crusticola TaxID=1697972 RepID=A0ABQ4R7F5_9HYPH|nr:hypothetical protein [Methylobacterium crusticola]GJD53090.1 hypothetical protein OPKNFCMD_5861 [Methylobacterium crusticola]
MTPVNRCLRRLDHASAITDSTVAHLIAEALDELEAAFARPSDRVVALEAVLHEVRDRSGAGRKPLTRFLHTVVDQRQSRLTRRASS